MNSGIFNKALTFIRYLLTGRKSEALPSEAIPRSLLKDEEGFNGPLGAAALLLKEEDMIVLSVDFFFTDMPSWLEWDAYTKKLGIVQMGGAVAALSRIAPVLLLGALGAVAHPTLAQVRARTLGIAPGIFTPGPLNAITAVEGVRVGQVTIDAGDSVRTGITAILPHDRNPFLERVPAAIHVGNGFGKLLGVTQVRELGELETPILLTCTLCVWRVADAVVSWMLEREGMAGVPSINPVVGETNDGGLSAIRSRPITPDQVRQALDGATGGPVAEGSVGAGRGTVAFGWKVYDKINTHATLPLPVGKCKFPRRYKIQLRIFPQTQSFTKIPQRSPICANLNGNFIDKYLTQAIICQGLARLRGTPPPKLAREKRDWNNPSPGLDEYLTLPRIGYLS